MADGQVTNAPRVGTPLVPLEERIGPPPAGVAPLDQFREALLLTHEADGLLPDSHTLQHTSAELLKLYRYEDIFGNNERRIRHMVDSGGWVEADAVVVRLLLSFVARGIGLAVRERRTAAAAICHGMHASIARVGEHMASPAPNLFLPAHGLPEIGLRHGLFDLEPLAAVFERYGAGEGGGDVVTLFSPLELIDNPLLLTERGALLPMSGSYHLSPGDVICIRSRSNVRPYCRTAALVIGSCVAAEYALPPNTQLIFEEVLEPPWTANFNRWHRYEDEYGVVFVDRSDSVYDAKLNMHIPTLYRPVNASGRTRYKVSIPNHPCYDQIVNAIDYSPDATFERTVTVCRCLVLTVAYDMPALPSASAPMRTRSLPAAAAAAAAPGSRGGASVASAAIVQAASRRAAAELKAKVEAADAAAASLVAEEEAEKAAEAAKQAKSQRGKQRRKQKKSGGSHGQPPSRGAQAAGRDDVKDEKDAADAAVAEDCAAAEATATAEAARRAAAEEAAREKAEREARRAGAEEAAVLEASRRLAEEEARVRAAAAAAEQERQMAMARAAADDPPDVNEICAAELLNALDAVGAQGEVGEGGFGKVFAAQLPSLPCWGRVAIKLATSMDPSALLREVALLRECRHPNVLPLLGFCGDGLMTCMITPLMRGGSLDDRLLLSAGALQRLQRLGFGGDTRLNWQQRLSALCDAARGLAHLHASRTFHRDVKTGNILLDGSLQPLQTAGSTLLVYRAFLSDVGLAKVREASARAGATTHATTSSVAFSTGFCDPLFINSSQHSEKSDSYGIGISALMCLVGRPAPGLVDDCVEDVMEAAEADAGDLLVAARVAAGWPAPAACALARVVWGLSCPFKKQRRPLPDALAAMEALLTSPAVAAAPAARQLAGDAPTAAAPVSEAAGEGAAREGAADGRGGGLTRLVGQLDRLAVDGGGDAALARLRKHINAAFLSLMTRLETKYEAEGHAALSKEMSEHDKINALAPRHVCPTLAVLAHTLRVWWNAAKHDRDRWKDPPSDRQVEEVVQGAMSELARLGW